MNDVCVWESVFYIDIDIKYVYIYEYIYMYVTEQDDHTIYTRSLGCFSEINIF